MHVGSSCFCLCVSVQKVSRKVDVWVPWCVSVILTHYRTSSTCDLFQPQPQLILTSYFSSLVSIFGYFHHFSDYPMAQPLAWRTASWKDSEKER